MRAPNRSSNKKPKLLNAIPTDVLQAHALPRLSTANLMAFAKTSKASRNAARGLIVQRQKEAVEKVVRHVLMFPQYAKQGRLTLFTKETDTHIGYRVQSSEITMHDLGFMAYYKYTNLPGHPEWVMDILLEYDPAGWALGVDLKVRDFGRPGYTRATIRLSYLNKKWRLKFSGFSRFPALLEFFDKFENALRQRGHNVTG